MPEVTSKTIEAPHNKHVEPPSSRVLQKRIQRRPSILRAADATINIVGGCPAACADVSAEFLKLVLRLLIERADAGVDGTTHGNLRVAAVPVKSRAARSTDLLG